MPSVFDAAEQTLARQAQIHDAALVAFSGGKDSLVTMDLACRHFRKVVGFHLYYLPGLKFIESWMAEAEKRWGVTIIQYPHWNVVADLRNAIYCPITKDFDSVPSWKIQDVYRVAREETGINLLLTGNKTADFAARRTMVKNNRDPNLVHPIQNWHNADVLAYLSTKGIPIPNAPCDAFGVDLRTVTLLWMKHFHPEDFATVCRTFPYAEAAVWRKEWYGIG